MLLNRYPPRYPHLCSEYVTLLARAGLTLSILKLIMYVVKCMGASSATCDPCIIKVKSTCYV